MIFFNFGQQLKKHIDKKFLKKVMAQGVLAAIVLSKTSVCAAEEAPIDDPTKEIIILDPAITVGEWKKINSTSDVIVMDQSGMELSDDIVIEDGYRAIIDGKEFELDVVEKGDKVQNHSIMVGSNGITVEKIKQNFEQDGYTNIVVKNEGEILADDVVISAETILFLTTDQAEIILEVRGFYKSINTEMTLKEYKDILQNEGAKDVSFLDKEGTVISDNSSKLEEGWTVVIDGVNYLIFSNNGENQYVLKEAPATNPPGDKKILPPIQNGPSQEELELMEREEEKARARAEEEAKTKAEAEAKAKAEREAREKAEVESKAKAEREAKEKAEAEAKAKAEREAKVKADAETKIKAEIKAKVEAKIKVENKAKSEAKAEAAILKKQVDTAEKAMDKKLKNWQEAKKELTKVNRSAKAINMAKGKPDMKQVGNVIGQYQGIVNELFKAKKYSDVVSTVSDAVEILKKKKVDKQIISGFVQKNINTSKSVYAIIKNIKEQKLDVSDLVEYHNDLKEKESQRAGGYNKII